jgi:sugar lactone lactonase YvrE
VAGGDERLVRSGISGSVNRIAWSHDSRHVFHISNNTEIWRLAVAGGESIDTGVRIPFVKRISVSPDGSRLALTGGSVSSEVWVWENLKPQVKGR